MHKYIWKSGGEEAYYIEDNQPGEALFPQPYIYSGEDLYIRISAKDHYVTFADLKAFKEKSLVQEIAAYEEFLNGPCEIVLLIVDCVYVTIYAKNKLVTEQIYRNAVQARYKNIAYITDENDTRTTMAAL